jgi:hypothetical protein
MRIPKRFTTTQRELHLMVSLLSQGFRKADPKRFQHLTFKDHAAFRSLLEKEFVHIPSTGPMYYNTSDGNWESENKTYVLTHKGVERLKLVDGIYLTDKHVRIMVHLLSRNPPFLRGKSSERLFALGLVKYQEGLGDRPVELTIKGLIHLFK